MAFQLTAPNLEYVAIRVKDLEKLIAFYQMLPGFHLLSEENNLAFFSSHEDQKTFLILEDTPFGLAEDKKAKKMARFSLRVKDVPSFRLLKEILVKKKIPFSKVVDHPIKKALTIADPEGNQLTFFVDEKEEASPFLYTLGKVHLNVEDKKEAAYFFNVVLGLDSTWDEGKYFKLNLEQWLGFNDEADKLPEPDEEVEVLGLDFITISLPNQEELQKLVTHFEVLGIPHFKDKKLTIVTLFDANQVEWWFVDRTNRKGRH